MAKTNPSNNAWQRTLALSHSKLADTYRRSNDPVQAWQHLTEGRAIIAWPMWKLPNSVGLKNDLAWFDGQINALK